MRVARLAVASAALMAAVVVAGPAGAGTDAGGKAQAAAHMGQVRTNEAVGRSPADRVARTAAVGEEQLLTANTKRLALGFHQANVTILPEHLAFDFMRFCQRNPRALPILDVTDPGDPVPRTAAPDADIRIDIPGYCIYRDGKLVDRVRDLRDHWRSDHVAFLTGCNLSIDQVLLDAGMPACGNIPRARGRQLSARS